MGDVHLSKNLGSYQVLDFEMYMLILVHIS